jgi:DNA polymerase III epsilon subunit family exonuclease
MPNYICDIKNPAENVVLCGRISGIQHKEYKNKKYNPNDPSSREPEMKPMFRCVIDDTTAKIECVCFPRQSDVDALKVLEENDQVICVGNVSISNYNGALSYALDGIFKCSIQFDSIQKVQNKPCPAKYTKVFPEPYSAVSQDSLFGETTVPEFLKDKAFVIFDFEATDKYINTAEPIELAAVKMVDGKITEVFQSFAKPSEPISDFITGLTSITNEMVRFSPKFEDILPDFFKFTRNAILVGHNISGYDYPLLEKYAREAGYKFDNDMVDTLLLAREHLKEFKRFDLESLSKNLNISHENAHRAIADVYATAELLKVLAKRLS